MLPEPRRYATSPTDLHPEKSDDHRRRGHQAAPHPHRRTSSDDWASRAHGWPSRSANGWPTVTAAIPHFSPRGLVHGTSNVDAPQAPALGHTLETAQRGTDEIPDTVRVLPKIDVRRVQRWRRPRSWPRSRSTSRRVRRRSETPDDHPDTPAVATRLRPRVDTLPIARLRYTTTTGLWELYWRDRKPPLPPLRPRPAHEPRRRPPRRDRAGPDPHPLGIGPMHRSPRRRARTSRRRRPASLLQFRLQFPTSRIVGGPDLRWIVSPTCKNSHASTPAASTPANTGRGNWKAGLLPDSRCLRVTSTSRRSGRGRASHLSAIRCPGGGHRRRHARHGHPPGGVGPGGRTAEPSPVQSGRILPRSRPDHAAPRGRGDRRVRHDTGGRGPGDQTVQPEQPDETTAAVASCIGVALALLDQPLSGRDPDAPQDLWDRGRLPAGHWTGERAATDILALACKAPRLRLHRDPHRPPGRQARPVRLRGGPGCGHAAWPAQTGAPVPGPHPN